MDRLFDIAGCQCIDLSVCSCKKELKIPRREHPFIIDQRSVRQMKIGPLDKEVTTMNMRRVLRAHRHNEREESESENRLYRERKIELSELHVGLDENEGCEESPEDENDDTIMFNCSAIESRNVVPIPTVAIEADRYGVSNRAEAAISTATLIDYGIIDSHHQHDIIDHNKVWRARQNNMRRLVQEEELESECEIQAIFFDGRKDIE